jgi:hypothetical protein
MHTFLLIESAFTWSEGAYRVAHLPSCQATCQNFAYKRVSPHLPREVTYGKVKHHGSFAPPDQPRSVDSDSELFPKPNHSENIPHS